MTVRLPGRRDCESPVPIPPTAGITLLSMSGEQGDYIGGPTDYYYNAPADGTFSASASDQTGDGGVDAVSISFMSSDHWWYLDFNTSRLLGKNLETGFYDDAQRAPFCQYRPPRIIDQRRWSRVQSINGEFHCSRSRV